MIFTYTAPDGENFDYEPEFDAIRNALTDIIINFYFDGVKDEKIRHAVKNLVIDIEETQYYFEEQLQEYFETEAMEYYRDCIDCKKSDEEDYWDAVKFW